MARILCSGNAAAGWPTIELQYYFYSTCIGLSKVATVNNNTLRIASILQSNHEPRASEE